MLRPETRSLLDVLAAAGIAEFAVRRDRILGHLDSPLKSRGESALAQELGVSWEPEFVSWLFDTDRIPAAARQHLVNKIADVPGDVFAQDWQAAEAEATAVLENRRDLGWAFDIAGWAAERRGESLSGRATLPGRTANVLVLRRHAAISLALVRRRLWKIRGVAAGYPVRPLDHAAAAGPLPAHLPGQRPAIRCAVACSNTGSRWPARQVNEKPIARRMCITIALDGIWGCCRSVPTTKSSNSCANPRRPAAHPHWPPSPLCTTGFCTDSLRGNGRPELAQRRSGCHRGRRTEPRCRNGATLVPAYGNDPSRGSSSHG